MSENLASYDPISPRRYRSLEVTDNLPGDLRQCVHEFGLPAVSVLVKWGVKSPIAIREIIKEIWGGARQEGQRAGARNSIDWLLIQNGASPSAVYRMLAENNMVLTVVEPTKTMVEASMAEVSGGNLRCTKYEKHSRRLRAALRAAINPMLQGHGK